MEVDLTIEDCLMIKSLFDRLHAKKHDDTEQERFLYSKILVFYDTLMRKEQELKDMMSEK